MNDIGTSSYQNIRFLLYFIHPYIHKHKYRRNTIKVIKVTKEYVSDFGVEKALSETETVK